MSLLRRFWNVLRGKTDAVLSKIENPAEQLSVVVADLDKQVKLQHQAVARAIADEKKLKIELEELISQSQEWEKKALYALQMGDESLAKEALVRKEEVLVRAQTLEKAWGQQKAATDTLRNQFQKAKDRVEDAKRQYTLMVAQYQSALSKKEIAKTASAMHDNSAGAAIERLKDKINLLEAEADADNLLSQGDQGRELDARFKTLETQMKADQALNQLKEKMAKSLGTSSTSGVSASALKDVTPNSSKKVGNG